MTLKIHNALNQVTMEGTIYRLDKDIGSGKTIFYLKYCNIMNPKELDITKQTIHVSEFQCQLTEAASNANSGKLHDGDLIRIQGFLAQCDSKMNVKIKVNFVQPALGIYRQG